MRKQHQHSPEIISTEFFPGEGRRGEAPVEMLVEGTLSGLGERLPRHGALRSTPDHRDLRRDRGLRVGIPRRRKVSGENRW